MAGWGAWRLLEKITSHDIEVTIRKKAIMPVHVFAALLPVAVFQAHRDLRYAYLVYFLTALFLISAIPWKAKKYGRPISLNRTYGSPHIAVLLILAFMGIFLFEAGGFYPRKSESGIDMARFLAGQQGWGGGAVEELWRAGGMLYLGERYPLENLDETSIRDRAAFISKITKDSITWVGVRDRSLEQSGYHALLNDLGFTEVTFSKKKRRDAYRLFKKSHPSAPKRENQETEYVQSLTPANKESAYGKGTRN